MDNKKVGLSDTTKAKTEPKTFRRNPIIGAKFTIAISSAKAVSYTHLRAHET